MEVISAADAAALLQDGQTVTVSGLLGNLVPERLLEAVEARFRATGAPRGGMHADEVLAQLQQRAVAPVGKNPKASLANALQRLARQGTVRRTGRNRWRRA